jgi:GAF domain-containing protein
MTREQRVTEIFVEVADSLTDDFDLIDFLQQLSVRCMELINVAAVGILLADQHDNLQTMAASDEHTRLLELFATQHDQGPCVECYKSGQARTNINLTDPAVTARWPQFAPRAAETGFVAANALPLRLRGRVIGTLALFQSDPDPLSDQDITLAQALADIATIAILQHQAASESRAVTEQLRSALDSRIAIEQAKGVIAEGAGVDMAEAFARLRTYSRANQRLLAEVAQEIVDGKLPTGALIG